MPLDFGNLLPELILCLSAEVRATIRFSAGLWTP